MAVVYLEGFDHYDFASQAGLKGWSNIGHAVSSSTTRFGTGLSLSTPDSGINTTHTLPSSYTTAIFGFAYLVDSGQNTSANIFKGLTAGGAQVFTVKYSFGPPNHFQICNAAGSVVATGSTSIAAGTWNYIEVKIFANGASGTCEMHLNGNSGSPEIASTTGNFGSTGIGQINFLQDSPTGGQHHWWDDVYVCDTTGSFANTFLGDTRVETLYPTGAGAHTQWTPDSGSNYARVNEAQANGDTSYVYDNNVGDRDSYAFGDLTSLTGSVWAVQTNLYARKDNTGTRQVCAVARPTTVDQDGATDTLSTSYQFFSELRTTNPDTSAQWTIGDVNGSEFGFKLVA